MRLLFEIDTKDYNPNGKVFIRPSSRALIIKNNKILMVCKFYLSHQDSWRANIDVVMNELRVAGFASRDESSTRMRISNIASLHTGVGLANASKQTVAVYNRLK